MTASSAKDRSSLALILRNSAFLLSSSVLVQLLSLVSGMMLTRHLQANGYGDYAFSYVFAWFVLMAMTLGTKGVILRDLPRAPEKAGFYLVQITALRGVTAVAAIGFTLAAGWWLDKPPDVRATMVIFMLLSASDGIALTFLEVFRGLENMRYEPWMYVGERIAVVLGIWIASRYGWGIVAIAQMMYGITLCRICAWLVPIHRSMKLPPVTIDWSFWRYLVQQGWQYLRVDLAAALVHRVDVLLLGILVAGADTGRYNAAYTVFMVAAVMPQMLTSALQPTSARLSKEAPDELIPTQLRIAGITLTLAMPVVIALGAAAPLIMPWLFGAPFAAAGDILRWLTLALPALALAGFVGNHFFATDRQDLMFRIILVNAALNIGLNLLLIPRMGAYGAVVATVTSELVALIAMIGLTWRSIGQPLVKRTLPIWAIGMMAYLAAIQTAAWNVWLAVPVGWLLYGLVLIATGRSPVAIRTAIRR